MSELPVFDPARSSLAELLLLVPLSHAQHLNALPQPQNAFGHILGGTIGTDVASVFAPALSGAPEVVSAYPEQPLLEMVQKLATYICTTLPGLDAQLVAIALLQYFLQCNFTGPPRPLTATEFPFQEDVAPQIQADSIELLSLEGQIAYEHIVEPFFLVLALALFERFMATGHLLLANRPVDTEAVLAEASVFVDDLANVLSAENASVAWWRARALQTQLSLLAEPVDVLASLSSVFLQQPVLNALLPAEPALAQNLRLAFLLENARNAIHAQTEHLAEPYLARALDVSQLELVLTGAKAKRTKFQTFHASSLVLLAQSRMAEFWPELSQDSAPQAHELNSDLLLEKPQYEALAFGAAAAPEADAGPDSKKMKLDGDIAHLVVRQKELLPISMHAENIPASLRALDPNQQPELANLDVIQLLLRVAIIKQTSPAVDEMVAEELLAVVRRIIYSAQGPSNWAIFGRALWERSLLETVKARTVERGILQMNSLVEEAGINVKTRTVPQLSDIAPVDVHSRLRYMHQLPLMGHWKMDATLAEKYMALGLIKSAIEIYERLNMQTEAALCYAAVDDEARAEQILVARIETHPRDARAISILGDVRQDPHLWQQAWDIGHYPKAKASLSKYYYQPPAGTDLRRDLMLAMQHMRDCLGCSPLSYENWFFYGCLGLESGNHDAAAEAFTRCVSLDDTNSHAWSNLASALLRLDKPRQAFTALKRALQQGEAAKRSWRIFENYLLVAARLGEWNDVLHATRELLKLRQNEGGDVMLDVVVLEKLVQFLVEERFPEGRMTHFQLSCVDLVYNMVPSAINHDARAWRLVGRVEFWRGRPWAALECAEKAYRATSLRPELDVLEDAWNDSVEACADLVSAYESLGELPGKHGTGDVVCKDWRYKARSCVRSLMSKGKQMWEDSAGWNRLQAVKEELSS